MARTKREVSSTGMYHVLLRGEQKLFLQEQDYAEFINLLKKYFKDKSQELFAYSLNENKVHLILFEGADGLSKTIKPFCTSYARYFNKMHQTDGKLFYDRYKSDVIENNDALLNSIVYVHKSKGHTSVSEYEGKAFVCCVDNAISKIGSIDIYKQRMSDNLSVMCIDDYENMTDTDIAYYVYELTGFDAVQIKELEQDEKKRTLEKLKNQKWISLRRLSEVLGISKTTADTFTKDKKPKNTTEHKSKPKQTDETTKEIKAEKLPVQEDEPKPEKPKEKPNRELSVWLL